jgi:hypothetical protein
MKWGRLEGSWVALRLVKFEFSILQCRKSFPDLSFLLVHFDYWPLFKESFHPNTLPLYRLSQPREIHTTGNHFSSFGHTS